jgi:hypothetical protein
MGSMGNRWLKSEQRSQSHHTFEVLHWKVVQTLPWMTYITDMTWVIRIFMLLVLGLAMLLFLAMASVVMLVSCVRWLLTGRKPDFVVLLNVANRYKNMARSSQGRWASDDTIEAEVREVPDDHHRLPK